MKKIEELHNFKCECDLCAQKELMNSLFIQGMIDTEYDVTLAIPAFKAAITGNTEILKEFFKTVWKDINLDPSYPKIFFTNYMNAHSYLKAAATYLTFPLMKLVLTDES